jgi:hypothetical protein
MTERVLIDDKKILFFEVFDIIEKLEKSEKPSLEKLPILINCAKDFYGTLDFAMERERISAWVFDEDSQTWKEDRCTVDQCVEQSKKAFEKYEEQKAVQNMSVAYVYYKDRYAKFLTIYKPFYDYSFKLLTTVQSSLAYVTEGKEKERQSNELKENVTSLEEKISYLKKELDERNAKIEEARTSMDFQIKTLKNYGLWLKLVADKQYLSTEIEARVVAYLLINGECDAPSMALKIKLDTPKTQTTCNGLEKRGVLKARKISRVSYFSLNTVFAEKPIMEGYDTGDGVAESLIDKIVAHKKKKALEEQEALDKANPQPLNPNQNDPQEINAVIRETKEKFNKNIPELMPEEQKEFNEAERD